MYSMSQLAMQSEKFFSLLGAAGFVAPRHMKAISETGNRLVLACDKVDSVGVLDNFFPQCTFYTHYETFLSHLEEQAKDHKDSLYTAICTPNYLHAQQILDALERGSHVICEKPLVLTLQELEKVSRLSTQRNLSVYPVHQLRLHPSFERMKTFVHQSIASEPTRKLGVRIDYHAPRGHWYTQSWKYDQHQSGGLLYNIGIHLFDLLLVLFGYPEKTIITERTDSVASGIFEFAHATADWHLSIDIHSRCAASKSQRRFVVEQEHFDFSQQFENLHTSLYRGLLENTSDVHLASLEDVQQVIQLIACLYESPILQNETVDVIHKIET